MATIREKGGRDRLLSVEDVAPIFRFVLTGGPCGGKTTAMARLKSFLIERGFRVFTVPEAATLLFGNGASFVDLPEPEQQLQFQMSLMDTQIHLEDTFAQLAQLSGKPSVLLCDRGLMDGSAYLEPEVWADLLDRKEMDVITARDSRYNGVFHLVTAADGAEEFYGAETNVTRLEGPEEARSLDGRVLRAWIGHPKLMVFDNSTDFETKLRRVVASMEEMVGLPTSRRKVKRYLLRSAPKRDDICVEFEEFDVEKVYLRLSEKEGRHPGDHTFVRRRGQQATASYSQTQVRYRGNGQKIERKQIISAREYSNAVRNLADPSRHVVRQRRISFLWKGQYMEVNEYLAPQGGLCTLVRQIHAATTSAQDAGASPVAEDTVVFPPWLDVERDATTERETSSVFISLKNKEDFDQMCLGGHYSARGGKNAGIAHEHNVPDDE